MGDSEYRYEIRIIEATDYQSHGDVSFWSFTNGVTSPTSPAHLSDKRKFPPGTVVLCRLRKGIFEGFAKVTKFSETGWPIEFGDSLSDRTFGRWKPPELNDIILDTRKKGKAKEIQ